MKHLYILIYTLTMCLISVSAQAQKGNGKGADETLGEAQMIILHKPLTPAEKVMTIPVSAWEGHAQHGDRPFEIPSLCSLPTSTELALTLTPGVGNVAYFATATVEQCTEEQALELLDPNISSVFVADPDGGNVPLLCEPVTSGEGDVSTIVEEDDGSFTASLVYACNPFID